jgi:hypothetical protein
VVKLRAGTPGVTETEWVSNSFAVQANTPAKIRKATACVVEDFMNILI